MSSLQETLSVTYIQEFCVLSKRLNGDDIKIGDKFPSLDGNIVYYSIPDSTTIVGKEYFIPVQVKGVLTDQIKDLKSIPYIIEMKHINNYFHNGGVLYLVVLLTKNADRKLYAKVLLPIDIKQIIKGKEEQDSVTVYMESVDNPNKLVQLCDLFSKNKAKQSIVIYNNIQVDFKNVTEYKISMLPADERTSIYDMLQSNNIYTYAVEGGIEKPIFAKIISMKEMNFNSYDFGNGQVANYDVKIIHTSGQKKVIISDLIECNNILDEREPFIFQYGWKLNFLKTYVGAIFARGLLLEGQQENQEKDDTKSNLIDYYSDIIKLGNILKKLKIPLEEFITSEVLQNKTNILKLKAIILDKVAIKLIDKPKVVLSFIEIGNKQKMVLFIQKEKESYIGYDFLYEELGIEIYGDVNDRNVKVNPWLLMEDYDLDRIYIEYNGMYKALSSIDLENPLYRNINSYVLLSIKKYDKEKLLEFLTIADDLTSKLLLKFPNDNSYNINKMQIKKRLDKLDLEDKKILIAIKQSSDDILELCCICILLDQLLEYQMYYSQLSEDEKEEFKAGQFIICTQTEFKTFKLHYIKKVIYFINIKRHIYIISKCCNKRS